MNYYKYKIKEYPISGSPLQLIPMSDSLEYMHTFRSYQAQMVYMYFESTHC